MELTNNNTKDDPESIKNQFSKAIHSGGKHIIINEDILLTETLVIDVDNIFIDGQGHTIQPSSRNTQIMVVSSNNVTLKNIIFKKASSNTDGAAINNQHGDLNIINCEFIGNYAHSSNGGAVHNYHGTLNIENCKFKDNRTNRNDGGAIYNFNGDVNVIDCTFENNYAKFGGAIYNGSKLNLINTNFLNNTSLKGQSIFNTPDSVINIENCEFENDDATLHNSKIYNMGTLNVESYQKDKIQDITHGGFIHIKSDNAKSFKFLNNIINSGKKEIKLEWDIINKEFKTGININEDDLIIDGDGFTIDGVGKGIFNIKGENITLKNISFRNGSSFEGGAINNHSKSLKLINCNFDCNISNHGGAINNYGKIDLENCSFNKNIANEDDGGAINNKGEINLTNCDFISNTANKNGGAINNLNIVNIKNKCNFKSNHAKNGASINNTGNAVLDIHETNFNGNKASEQGSVIYNENIVRMEKCDSSNNISNKFSNIIFQKGDENSKLDIQDCTFSRDKFNNNLIFVENGTCDINSTKFQLNKEHENSYAIYNENAILKLKNIEFENCSSETIFNNNEIHIPKDENIENFIQTGDESLPFKYTNN